MERKFPSSAVATYLDFNRIFKRYLNGIKRNNFQKSVNARKTYFNVFWGATSKRLNHYTLPTLHEDQPDVVLLHNGSNNINNQTKDKVNTVKLTEDIINIGKFCIDLGMKEVIESSILPDNNIASTRLIRQVNDRFE